LDSGVQTPVETPVPQLSRVLRKRFDHRRVQSNGMVDVRFGGIKFQPESVASGVDRAPKNRDSLTELLEERRQIKVGDHLELGAQSSRLTEEASV
jgi:hypothetical protein